MHDSVFSKYVLHVDAYLLAALEDVLGSVIRILSGRIATPLDEALAQCFAELVGYKPQAPQRARGKVIIVFDPNTLSVDTLLPLKLAVPGMTFSICDLITTIKLRNTEAALVAVEAERPGVAGNLVVGTRLAPLAAIQGIHHILANEDFSGGADALDAGYLLIRELELLRTNIAAPPPVRALAASKLPKIVTGFWHDDCFYVSENTYLTTKVALIPVSAHGTTILQEGRYQPFYEVLGVLDGINQECDCSVTVEREALDAKPAKVTLKRPPSSTAREHALLIVRAIPDLLAVHLLLSKLNVPVRAANLAILRIVGAAESSPMMNQVYSWCHAFLHTHMRDKVLNLQEIRDALNAFGIEVRTIEAEHLTVEGRKKITGTKELSIPDETTVWVYDDNTFDISTVFTPNLTSAHAEVSENAPV